MSETKRGLILSALATAYGEIQTPTYNTDLYNNVKKKFIFPDEDPELPLVTIVAGPEQIVYQPGGPQDRYLTVNMRIYVEDADDPVPVLEALIQDVEVVTEKYSRLLLSDGSMTRDVRVVYIDTDQGVLAPLGVAEIQLIVEY